VSFGQKSAQIQNPKNGGIRHPKRDCPGGGGKKKTSDTFFGNVSEASYGHFSARELRGKATRPAAPGGKKRPLATARGIDFGIYGEISGQGGGEKLAWLPEPREEKVTGHFFYTGLQEGVRQPRGGKAEERKGESLARRSSKNNSTGA